MSATDNTQIVYKGNTRHDPITSNAKSNLDRLFSFITTPTPIPKPTLELKKEFKERKTSGREDFFINPLTGRSVKNNAVSRYRINKAIRTANVDIQKFNEEQINNAKTIQQRTNIKGSKLIDAYNGFASIQIDMQNINDLQEYFDTIRFRVLEIEKNKDKFGSWFPTHVKILFEGKDLNDKEGVFGYTFKSSMFIANEYDEFTKIVSADNGFKLNPEKGGSDILSVDVEPVLNQSSAIIYLGATGVGAKKFKTCFDIVDVNKTNDDVKNRKCVSNCFAYAGYNVTGLTNIVDVVEYIKTNNLPIKVINNDVYDIVLNSDKSFKYSNTYGCNLNDCKFKLNVIYEPEFFNNVFVFGDDHLDVIKNKDKLFRDDVLITYELNIIEMDTGKPIHKRSQIFKKAKKQVANVDCEELEYVFFDYETIVEYSFANCMKPYSISWFHMSHKDVDNFNFSKNDLNTKNCFNHIGWDCSEVFYKWIVENQQNKRFVFISYNGVNFDNYLLMRSFMQMGGENIISNVMYNGNQLLNFKINGRHTMYDLHKHLMGSLKSNCESFKIPKKYSKLDCDHNEIQALYNNDNETFINIMKHREALVDYNNNDVLALCCLFIKYYQALRIEGFDFLYENEGVNFTNATTIGGIIMKRAKEHWNGKEEFKSDLLDVKKYQDILKYKIAGRVEVFNSKPIKIQEEVVSLDVCSLYPYIMFIHPSYFPTGNIVETTEYFKPDDKLGFWYCDIDQRALKQHGLPNIYAEKTATENKWDSEEILTDYLISNITIELLKSYENIGVKVNVKNGFYWTNKVRGFDMFNFLAPLMKEKNNQDDLKKTKADNYNPALRETCKLLMNSISGKVIEGLHNETVKMIDQSDFAKMLCKFPDLNFINNVDANLFVSYKRPDEELINKQSPVYLGAFIYEYARTYMWNNLLSKLGNSKCLYMDTDAVKFRKVDVREWMNVVGGKMVPHWDEVENIDARYKSHILYNENSKVFGSFENELHENNVFYALQKKIWLTAKIEENGDVSYIKTRYKGVNPRSFLLGEDDKLNVNNYLECFDWCQENQNKMIKSDYEGDAEDMGKQLDFFNQLYDTGSVNVLCTNFKKSVKNNCRSVKIDDNDKKNRLNNTIRFIYMIKTLRINKDL